MAKHFEGQEYAAATNGKGLRQGSWWSRFAVKFTITTSIVVMFVSLGMIAFCTAFLLSPIMGTSMMTRLNATGLNTDSAITCRLVTPTYGDIVIAKLYAQDTNDWNTPEANLQIRYDQVDGNGRYMFIIKRLIANSGDKLSIRREPNTDSPITATDYNYYLYVNGVKLNESYLDPMVAHPSSKNFIQLWNVLHRVYTADLSSWRATNLNDYLAIENGEPTLTIPEGYYFLMGDNRDGFNNGAPSWDSCYLGPQNKDNLLGVCVDVIDNQTSIASYLWQKIVYYAFFGWAWQNA